MSERTLRELHLVPFQIAIRESNPWCVMASYSKINRVYASNNKRLLTDILRREWGYDGIVMSDWFGVNSICPSVEAGLDLEMPGPPRKRGKNLVNAVNLGYMKESSLDSNVRRILELVSFYTLSCVIGSYRFVDLQDWKIPIPRFARGARGGQ